jgi:hypothetical protein
MPDLYIGGNVTMRIVDTGYNVEFWILTDQYTYNHQQQWAWSDSGVMTFDMNNRGSWQRVGYVGIGNSRNVGWTIYNSGLGFPTSTISMYVSRATVPPAPSPVSYSLLTNTSVRTTFSGRGDGGSPIREWQLAFGGDPNGANNFIGSNGINDLSGFAPGITYYFWARGRNDLGWSAWSARTQVTMQNVPGAPTSVVLSNILQNSIHASYRQTSNGGVLVDQWELAYGTDPNVPQVQLVGGAGTPQMSGEVDLTNLDPGKTYYFWARGHNRWGWGPYSARTQAQLVAGALIPVNGVMRRAVPYVNVAGVWKLARPWGKSGGTWRSASS